MTQDNPTDTETGVPNNNGGVDSSLKPTIGVVLVEVMSYDKALASYTEGIDALARDMVRSGMDDQRAFEQVLQVFLSDLHHPDPDRRGRVATMVAHDMAAALVAAARVKVNGDGPQRD